MQIEQIEYIVEVARAGSISGAAQNIHVSSATISQSISNFEKKYGVKIFNRSRLGTIPTDKGKSIIEKALEIKNKLLELELEANSQNISNDVELRLVVSPSVLQSMVPKVISLFKKTFPHIEIKITEEQNVVEEMLNHDSDIGFFLIDENEWLKVGNLYKNVLFFDTLFQGRIYVCVNRDSPISYKESITPDELLDQTLVMYPLTKPIYDDISIQYGKLNVLFQSSNIETIKNSIIEGIGISILSGFSVKNDPNIAKGVIVPVPLVNYERSNLTVGYIRSKKRSFSSSSREFLNIVKKIIKDGHY